METVKIKLLENGMMPTKGSNGAAAYDLYATCDIRIDYVETQGWMIFPTMPLGFSMEIPDGYAAFIYPRSGLGSKGLGLANTVGIIDSDFRGELKAVFNYIVNGEGKGLEIKKGDRILQMVIQKLPDIELVEASELSETERGSGGYGSTGK